MLTYELIVNSFKKLMLEKDFSKITVKMIALESGIMRSTFYNYYQDKYEILEWIIDEDILRKVELPLARELYADAMRLVFKCFAEDRAFYKKAFEIRGQNGFEEILVSKCIPLFMEAYKSVDFHYSNPLITRENIAQYQSIALVTYLKMWIADDCYGDADYNDVCEAFIFMLTQGNNLISPSNSLSILAREIRKVFKKDAH